MELLPSICWDIPRLAYGFANPNHAAALVCAILPLCVGWRRGAWLGWLLAGVLFALLLLTQSRTGLLIAGLEIGMWCGLSRQGSVRTGCAPLRWGLWIAPVLVGAALWWMWPRLALDESILNRPKIWLAGLRLFAANPGGVGLGNSGAIASAFLLDGIPEIRTLISAHITLLAEFGWIVGWAWFAFIVIALFELKSSPRMGIAFVGLVLSGCSSTAFDWPVLFDFVGQGELGMTNGVLSWMMLLIFVAFGVRLAAGVIWRTRSVRPAVYAVVLAGVAMSVLRLVPAGNAPQACDGYVMCGEAPQTLVLYDGSWSLKMVVGRMAGGTILPIRGIAEFPRGLDWTGVNRVVLLGDCCEWRHLVKGVPVECVGK